MTHTSSTTPVKRGRVTIATQAGVLFLDHIFSIFATYVMNPNPKLSSLVQNHGGRTRATPVVLIKGPGILGQETTMAGGQDMGFGPRHGLLHNSQVI